VLQTGFRAGNALVPPKRSVDLEAEDLVDEQNLPGHIALR